MAIITHAKYYRIERARHPRKRLPSGYRTEIRRGRAVLQAEETGSGGMVLQQHLTYQALIARGVLWVHPTLIGEGNADASPIERLRAQYLEKSHRRSAAGNDQTRETSCTDPRREIGGDLRREFARQGLDIG